MENVALIGIALGKHSFHLHCQDKSGKALQRKKFTRTNLMQFLATCPSTVVVMEACAGAHFMARRISDIGHEAKLISSQFVRPFVKSNKMILSTLRQYAKPHRDHQCGLSSPEPKFSRRCERCIGPENHLSETR